MTDRIDKCEPINVARINGLSSCCFTSSEQYVSYIHDEIKFINHRSGEKGSSAVGRCRDVFIAMKKGGLMDKVEIFCLATDNQLHILSNCFLHIGSCCARLNLSYILAERHKTTRHSRMNRDTIVSFIFVSLHKTNLLYLDLGNLSIITVYGISYVLLTKKIICVNNYICLFSNHIHIFSILQIGVESKFTNNIWCVLVSPFSTLPL